MADEAGPGGGSEFETRVKVSGEDALEELRKRFKAVGGEVERLDQRVRRWRDAADERWIEAQTLKLQEQQKTIGGLRANWLNWAAATYLVRTAASAARKVLDTMLTKSIADAERFTVLSRQFGIPIQTLSALSYQAQQAGVSFEGMAVGIRTIGQRLIAAKNGNDQAVATFKALGLSAKDVNRLLGQDLVKSSDEIVGRLSKVTNQALRAELGFRLAGRGGRDLLGALQEGSLEKFVKEARELGLIMDDVLAKRFKTAGDAITKTQGAVRGFFQTLAADSRFIEIAVAVFTKITQAIVDFRTSADFPILAAMIQSAGQAIQALTDLGAALLHAGRQLGLIRSLVIPLGLAFTGMGVVLTSVEIVLRNLTRAMLEFGANILETQSKLARFFGFASHANRLMAEAIDLRLQAGEQSAAITKLNDRAAELSDTARALLGDGLKPLKDGLDEGAGAAGAYGAGLDGASQKAKAAAQAFAALKQSLNAVGDDLEQQILALERLDALRNRGTTADLARVQRENQLSADIARNRSEAEKAILEARKQFSGAALDEAVAVIRATEEMRNSQARLKLQIDETTKSLTFRKQFAENAGVELAVLTGKLTQVEAETLRVVQQAIAAGVTGKELAEIREAARAMAILRRESEGMLDLWDAGQSIAKDFWDSVIIGGRDFGDFMKTLPASFGKVLSDAFFRGLKAKNDFDKKFEINIYNLVKNAGQVLAGQRGIGAIFEDVFGKSAKEAEKATTVISKILGGVGPEVASQLDLAVESLAKLNAAGTGPLAPGQAEANAQAIAEVYGIAVEDLKAAFVAFEEAAGGSMTRVAGAATTAAGQATDAWGGFFGQLLQLAGGIIKQILGMFGGLGNSLVNLLGGLFGGGGGGGSIVGTVVNAVGNLFGGQGGGGGGGILDSVAGLVKSAFSESGIGNSVTTMLKDTFGEGGALGQFLGKVRTFFTTGNVGAVLKTAGSIASTVGGAVAAYTGFAKAFDSKAGGGERILGGLQGLVGSKVALSGVSQFATALEGVLGQLGFKTLAQGLHNLTNNFTGTIAGALKQAIVQVAPKLAAQIGIEVGGQVAANAGTQAGGQAAGTLGGTIVTGATGVLALAGLALSVKGVKEAVDDFKKAVKHDRAGTNFQIGSAVGTGAAAAAGAGIGALVGIAGGPIGIAAGAAVGAATGAAVSQAVQAAISSSVVGALSEELRRGGTQKQLNESVKNGLQREGWGAWLLNVLSAGVNSLLSLALAGLVTPDIEKIFDKNFQSTVRTAGKFDVNRQLQGFGINRQQRELFGQRGPLRQQARDLTGLVSGLIGAGTDNGGRITRFFNILTGSLSTGKRSVAEIEEIMDRIARNMTGNLYRGLRIVTNLFEKGADGANRTKREVNLILGAFEKFLPKGTAEAVKTAQRDTGGIDLPAARRAVRENVLKNFLLGIDFTEKQAKKLGDGFLLLATKLTKQFKFLDVTSIALAAVTREADKMRKTLSEAVKLQAALVAAGLELSPDDAAAAGEEIAGAPRGRRRRRTRKRVTTFATALAGLEQFERGLTTSGADAAVEQARKASQALLLLNKSMSDTAFEAQKLKGKKLGEALKSIADMAGKATEAAKAWGDAVLGLLNAVREGERALEDARLSHREEVDALRKATDTHLIYNDAIAKNVAETDKAVSAQGKLNLLLRRADLLRARANAEIQDVEEAADARRETINKELDAANKELEGIQGLAGLLDGVKDQIASITQVALDPTQRAGNLQEQLARAQGEFVNAQGEDKVKAAQRIQAVGGELIQAAAEAFGPGSAMFESVQADVLANLGAVQAEAQKATDRQVELLELIEKHQAELELIDKETAEKIKLIQLQLAQDLDRLFPEIDAAMQAAINENRAALDALLPDDVDLEALLADPIAAQLYVGQQQVKMLEDIKRILEAGIGQDTGPDTDDVEVDRGNGEQEERGGGGKGKGGKGKKNKANLAAFSSNAGFGTVDVDADRGGAVLDQLTGLRAVGGNTFHVTIQINVPAGSGLTDGAARLYARTAADEFEAQLLAKLGGKLPRRFGT